MIGQTVLHYKVIEKLGEGGMGVVYKAQDTNLDRTVALKLLPRNLLASPESKSRFIREATSAARINHPNVAVVYQLGEVDDPKTSEKIAFIAMEYVDGVTLKHQIHERHLSVDECLRIARSMAEGLAAAHAQRIVHRDIKSENIMISRDGTVKIMDFGLAVAVGGIQLTKEGTTVGTIAYMSPEQARGESVDQRTDIWSAGVVLYEMLTGRLPFAADYDQAVIYRMLNEDPAPPSSLRDGISPDLDRIVMKALSKDVQNRYQQMSAFLGDLKSPGDGNFTRSDTTAMRSATTEHRIAVLPLANISADPSDQYFADGMTEELIARLSKVNRLRVIARTSVMQYRDTTKGITEIGRELGVGTVIEGSVRKSGERVRIRVQLVDAKSQEHLWSDDYDRDFRDIFAIQSDVAQRVASTLRIKLMGDEHERIAKEATGHVEAYNAYLKGRFFLSKRTQDGIARALEYFHTAIAEDPGYALAYAGIADAYLVLGLLEFLPPQEAFPKAMSAAQKAIGIDPLIAEAFACQGVVKFQYEWNWKGAEDSLLHALTINPNYGTAHHYYADFLKAMGRFEEALGEIRRAQALDPLSLAINTGVGHVLYLSRQYDRAIEQYRKTVEMDPTFLQARLWFGRPYLQKGLHREAIEELKAAVELSHGSTIALAMLGHAYAASGNSIEAVRILDSLTERSRRHYVPSYWVGMVYIGLGEKDTAFSWLEKAYEERSCWLAWLKVEPRFDILRSDPRFDQLLKRMGLTPGR